jgi:hypothetical protein
MNTTHTNKPIEQKEKQKATPLLDELDLRDYFAAKAMQGLLHDASHGDGQWEFEAKAAYKIADAMLEAREK